MIIENSIAPFIVLSEESVLAALNKITKNQSRIIFCIANNGTLEGVLTDGDFRRWLVKQKVTDLTLPISEAMNRDFKAGKIDDDPIVLKSMLSKAITQLPLVDKNNRLTAIAFKSSDKIFIENFEISPNSPTFIIAEIGNNHNGSLKNAKKLIRQAKESGADCAKFQMRDIDVLYNRQLTAKKGFGDLGTEYTLDLLSRFQLSDQELFKAFDYCREINIIPLCTPWDTSSLEKLERYNLPAYKVASADLTNFDLLAQLTQTRKPLLVSTGMSTEDEIKQSTDFLNKHAANFILLHCNSTYPTPFKDVNLNYLEKLKEFSNGLVGYSGHERDLYIAIAAVAKGAKVVEKHFTLDKTLEGTDHKVSLLPEEFSVMTKGIRQLDIALGEMKSRTLSQGEKLNREILAKSLVATRDLPAGTTITEAMVDVKSPGTGLQPNKRNELHGKVLQRSVKKGDCFFTSDIKDTPPKPRNYFFDSAWGIPARYHDINHLSSLSNPDLLEIHLSYRDMEKNFKDYIKQPFNTQLVVHAPELFESDHILDLCATDNAYRDTSIKCLQKVIDLTSELAKMFNGPHSPLIITNVGGFTKTQHLPEAERPAYYLRLIDSLNKLNTRGLEIIPQTMPPYPWHFGGQQYHNIFVDGDEIASFCSAHNMRICLDISHSKLACNHNKKNFISFMRKVAPFTAHFHLADASGVDGEGLQIGEGEVEWGAVIETLMRYAPTASFIPEIWQGHKNNGEGFWIALEKLEATFRDVAKRPYNKRPKVLDKAG